MLTNPEIPGADRQPNSYWAVACDDARIRETDEEVRARLEASGIDMSGSLDRMLASMGEAFGDPGEIIDKLVAELPPEWVDRVLDAPLKKLDDILDELIPLV